MRSSILYISIILFTLLAPVRPAFAHHDGLVLMYNDIEPDIVAHNNGVSGFLAKYLILVAQDANITPVWQNIPWERQLSILKQNRHNVCAVSLYKTNEREAYMRFTPPVSTDDGFSLISVANNEVLLAYENFKGVLDDDTLTPILQINSVYNPYINKLLEKKNFPKTKGLFSTLLSEKRCRPPSNLLICLV